MNNSEEIYNKEILYSMFSTESYNTPTDDNFEFDLNEQLDLKIFEFLYNLPIVVEYLSEKNNKFEQPDTSYIKQIFADVFCILNSYEIYEFIKLFVKKSVKTSNLITIESSDRVLVFIKKYYMLALSPFLFYIESIIVNESQYKLAEKKIPEYIKKIDYIRLKRITDENILILTYINAKLPHDAIINQLFDLLNSSAHWDVSILPHGVYNFNIIKSITYPIDKFDKKKSFTVDEIEKYDLFRNIYYKETNSNPSIDKNNFCHGFFKYPFRNLTDLKLDTGTVKIINNNLTIFDDDNVVLYKHKKEEFFNLKPRIFNLFDIASKYIDENITLYELFKIIEKKCDINLNNIHVDLLEYIHIYNICVKIVNLHKVDISLYNFPSMTYATIRNSIVSYHSSLPNLNIKFENCLIIITNPLPNNITAKNCSIQNLIFINKIGPYDMLKLREINTFKYLRIHDLMRLKKILLIQNGIIFANDTSAF